MPLPCQYALATYRQADAFPCLADFSIHMNALCKSFWNHLRIGSLKETENMDHFRRPVFVVFLSLMRYARKGRLKLDG